MFAIFITHSSFQLYYCYFPREYLKAVHNSFPSVNTESAVSDTTTSAVFDLSNTVSAIPRSDNPSPVAHPGVTLQSTKLYDFCNVTSRGEWLDILVALIEYLRSGESKVVYLNKDLERNMLHKNVED